jgi:hypothetical protein
MSSGTSRHEAEQLIPQFGDLEDAPTRKAIICAVAAALDKAFAEGVEHVESVEFLGKVAELAKRPSPLEDSQ